LIKGSKNLDSSLVSNKNFSETLRPSGWTLGQVTWAKMAPKLLHLWCHSQKICNPQPKKIFFCRNLSRSSKVSKDSDSSLVSNKNLSEILPSNDWRPKLGKVGQEVLNLWHHSKETHNPQPKNFFQVQTTRLVASFDTSTRSVTHTGAEIFPCKATCDPAVFCEPLELTQTSKC